MSLVKNSAWNIAGYVIPSLIALPAMGLLARSLGVERFGLFTLAYAVVGYASIFDAGLARAVTRAIAQHRRDVNRVLRILGTASLTVFLLSLLAGSLLWCGAQALADLLNVTPANFSDAVAGLELLSLSVPFFLTTLVWQAYLEGTENFADLTIQKTFTNSLLALLPLLCVWWRPTLTSAIAGIIAGRAVAALVSFWMCKRKLPAGAMSFDKGTLKGLVNFGGWITVSNLISPIMVYFDRFVVSHLSGAQYVGFYTAPAEAITRMSIVPAGVTRALFPKLSDDALKGSHVNYYRKTLLGLLVVCAGLAFPVFVFGEQILTLWLGKEYSGEPVLVLRILLIGFLFNSIAHVPYSFLQARGFSRTTATIHLLEVVPYLVLLYFLVAQFSFVGAAMAWSARMIVDCVIQLLVVQRFGN